jgi:peroxiredoxin (alkyl hydroperoxide reductase subunit C)
MGWLDRFDFGRRGIAMNEFRSGSLPRLNEPAPDFHARTTMGERKLIDYRGRWLFFFSHPSGFTPVCTSEFVAFARAFEQFQKLNCDLLGLSIDSNPAHLAWVHNIQEKFGVEIPFPIVEDVTMKVSTAYGMLMPGASDTATVRSTFLIDPDGILRAILCYPINNGRSIEEFLRLLQAVQVSDQYKVVTPEGWKPGDKVVLPPPNNMEAMKSREKQTGDCVDWYYCQRELKP